MIAIVIAPKSHWVDTVRVAIAPELAGELAGNSPLLVSSFEVPRMGRGGDGLVCVLLCGECVPSP